MEKKFNSDKGPFQLPEEYQLTSSEDSLDEDDTPGTILTRDTRNMILAEEILRFAFKIDKQVAARKAEKSKTSPDSTSEIKVEPTVTNVAQKTPIASVAGTSGAAPTQGAAGDNVQPSTSKSQDACIPVEAAVITKQEPRPSSIPPVFRPNIIPVTNRILAAIAQSKLEGSASDCQGSIILEPIPDDMEQFWPKTNRQLLGFFVEHLKLMLGSDASHSSSSDSAPAAPRASQSTSTRPVVDKLTKLNQKIEDTDQLEDIVTKTMQVTVSRLLKSKHELKTLNKLLKDKLETLQKEEDESGEVDEEKRDGGSSQQRNSQDKPKGNNDNEHDEKDADPEQKSQLCAEDDDYTTATTPDGTEDEGEIVEDSAENDDQQGDHNNPNDNSAEGSQGEGVDDEPELSEFPELDDDSLELEWPRPEKRRLHTVMRDLSREIKRKELMYKKARLIQKGRVVAQAIENKIAALNREIMGVDKKSLKNLVRPLDQVQEYDWERVANILNAKRTPQECRLCWTVLLHPSINSKDWKEVEIKRMEMIAQRHNFRNWDAIAAELNTDRTGPQCYLFYRRNLCPHTELRKKHNNQ